jgi:phage FluMu protein Com
MPISFRCSECNQLLRVPDTAAGKSARCPKCQALMTVPASGEEGQNAPQPPAGQPGGWSAPESSPAAAGGSTSNDPFAFLQQPAAGGAPPPKPPPSNPFGDAGGSSPFGGGTQGLNPYSSPAPFAPTISALEGAPVVAQAINIDPILSYAWRLWQIHLGLLLGVTVAIMVIGWVVQIPFGVMQVVLDQQNQPEAAAGVNFLGTIVTNLVQLYLGIGQAQIALKLARRQPAAFADLFGGAPLFLPVLGASLLFGIALFFGILLLIIPGIILAILLWPYYYLLVDQKTGIIDSFSTAMTLGQMNWVTTIVLFLLSMGIMILGCLACGIGLLFAAPLVTMLWAVGYLMMAGQIPTNPA